MPMSVLVGQFSGQSADDMRKTYAEFCSRHLKVVKLYKELLTRDKKFQSFIRVRNPNNPVCSSFILHVLCTYLFAFILS